MLFLLLVLIVVGLCVVALGVLLNAWVIIHPPRMTDGKAVYLLKRLSPADLQLPFEPVDFFVKDEFGADLKIAGWWMPNPAGGDRTVVLVHGYADAKVGAIAWAPLWRNLGFHILAIDLRAHGESGGKCCTGGVRERDDLRQVLDQLRRDLPAACERLVLMGISLGASVVLAAAEGRDDLAALVLECPFAHFRQAVREHSRATNLPLLALLPLSLRAAEHLAGIQFDAIDPIQLISSCPCPILAIQSGRDALVPAEQYERIGVALKSRADASAHWLVAEATHLAALTLDPAAYEIHLKNFLAKAGSL